MHSDLARAQIVVQRAVDGWTVLLGGDHEVVLESRAMVLTKNAAFGHSIKWKTNIDDVPEGLGPDEFEDWLWKRGEYETQGEHEDGQCCPTCGCNSGYGDEGHEGDEGGEDGEDSESEGGEDPEHPDPEVSGTDEL